MKKSIDNSYGSRWNMKLAFSTINLFIFWVVAFDNLDSEINDASLAAVFYNEIPTLGMRVSMVARSGRANVSLMNGFKEQFKEIVNQFCAQGFPKIQNGFPAIAKNSIENIFQTRSGELYYFRVYSVVV